MLTLLLLLRMAHLITGLIFLPILGAIFLSVMPRMLARAAALGCSVITALVAAAMWYHFDPTITGLQMVQRHLWIPAIGAQGLLGRRWTEPAAGSAHLARLSYLPFSRGE